MNKHYFWIKAKVNNYYRFITKLNNIDVKVEQIKYIDKIIYLKVDDNAYERIKKYLISYDFKKDKELGIYNVFDIFKKHRIFVISLLIGVVLFIFVSNLIVDVKVIHEDSQLREILLDELDEYGIKKLSLKKRYKDLQIIKQRILDKYPDKLDWLEFEIKGMNFIVRVEERIITNIENNNDKCNIVAKKDGMISSIKLTSGVANVALFDNVKEGDILISGIVKNNDFEVSRVCAEGEVFANTWYKVSVTIPFEYITYNKTGKKKYNIILSNGINETRIFKKRFKSFDFSNKTLLKFFDYRIILETEYENIKVINKYSEKEALDMALIKAEENVLKKLNNNDEVIDKKVLKKSINDSTIYVEVFLIANEQIGYTSKIDEGIDSNDYNNT